MCQISRICVTLHLQLLLCYRPVGTYSTRVSFPLHTNNIMYVAVLSTTSSHWTYPWLVTQFSLIIRSLFDSFSRSVSTVGSSDHFSKTVLAWLQQHCSLVSLRPGLSVCMCVHLPVHTSVYLQCYYGLKSWTVFSLLFTNSIKYSLFPYFGFDWQKRTFFVFFLHRRGKPLHRLGSNLAGNWSAMSCQIWPQSAHIWGFLDRNLPKLPNFLAAPLAVAWQSDKLESVKFLKFRNRIFCIFGTPCRKAASYPCRIIQVCCRLAFSACVHCLQLAMLCVSSCYWDEFCNTECSLLQACGICSLNVG